jgi:putative chitinase
MSANLANYLGILLLGGLLGIMGQGVRTVVGLKKMFDQADSQGVGQYDLFLASRLLISLFIGFVAGAAAAFFTGIKSDGSVDLSTSTLMAFAAAGYTGGDFIEGLASRFTTNAGAAAAKNN